MLAFSAALWWGSNHKNLYGIKWIKKCQLCKIKSELRQVSNDFVHIGGHDQRHEYTFRLLFEFEIQCRRRNERKWWWFLTCDGFAQRQLTHMQQSHFKCLALASNQLTFRNGKSDIAFVLICCFEALSLSQNVCNVHHQFTFCRPKSVAAHFCAFSAFHHERSSWRWKKKRNNS